MRLKLSRPFYRGLAVIGSGHITSILGEDQLESIGDDFFIVRNKNALLCRNVKAGHLQGKQSTRLNIRVFEYNRADARLIASI